MELLGQFWRFLGDSNPWHPDRQSSALPTELRNLKLVDRKRLELFKANVQGSPAPLRTAH